MNRQKAKNARVFGWFYIGLSIVAIAVYTAKSLIAGDRDVSPALPILGMAVFFAGIISLARAKKASQDE
jgi:hypothetical protein